MMMMTINNYDDDDDDMMIRMMITMIIIQQQVFLSFCRTIVVDFVSLDLLSAVLMCCSVRALRVFYHLSLYVLPTEKKIKNYLCLLQVSPGLGWDNLRNVEASQVVDNTYHLCRTTDNGRYLIPDSVFTVPHKVSIFHGYT